MKRFSVVCLLALAPVAPAAANIIPVNTSIVETSPGIYAWTYNLQLSRDQNVNSGAAPSVNPVPAINESRGGFLTIHDCGGYISGSCSNPVGWTCTSQLIGFTPVTVLPALDDATLLNITWAYTTGDVIGGQPDGKNLGDFLLQSTFSEPGLVAYTARGIANGGPQVDTIADNVGSTQGPLLQPTRISIASSLLLTGLGLTMLGVVRRRKMSV